MAIIDKKGFVVVDQNKTAYWIKESLGRIVMLIWVKVSKKWVAGSKVDLNKVDKLSQLAISDSDAEKYHKQHKQTTGKNPLNL